MAESSRTVDVTGRSALQIAGMIQSGLADPEAVAEATLAAIAADNEPGLFLLVTADRARRSRCVGQARPRWTGP